jgi:hypothetical protein
MSALAAGERGGWVGGWRVGNAALAEAHALGRLTLRARLVRAAFMRRAGLPRLGAAPPCLARAARRPAAASRV